MKKTVHIAIITLLALNLMGSWAFALAGDCGMECCAVSDTATAGVPVFEAPSCCSSEGTTCNFESTPHEELFDEVLCCFAQSHSAGSDITASYIFASASLEAYSYQNVFPGDFIPSYQEPLFLKNLSILC